MIELENITVSDYANLDLKDQEPYNFAMAFVHRFNKPVDEYKIGDVMELPFGFIKDFQFELEQNTLSWLKMVEFVTQVLKKETIKDEPLEKFSRFSQYLKAEVQKILEVEEKTLAYESTSQELDAGMDRFKGLGVYLQIRKLTGGDITRYDQVRNLPYSLCFTELYTSKQLYEYEQELKKKR